MAGPETDVELKALATVLGALTPLDPDVQTRVMDYVLQRLGLAGRAVGSDAPSRPASLDTSVSEAQTLMPPVSDIRSLREQKKPKSANEMAALVAYYLTYAAPEAERKEEISAKDIKKYFHQANFRLPGDATMTLVNAKNAGYLDAGPGRGSYRLNPVGYNLVAHRLPASGSSGAATSRSRRPRPSAKTSRSAGTAKHKARKAR